MTKSNPLTIGRTYDEKRRKPQNPTKTSRAERDYERALKQLAEHVGLLISGSDITGLDAAAAIQRMLEDYAQALTPWATKTASRMLTEVNGRNLESWLDLGQSISQQLHRDITRSPVGDLMRSLLAEQVSLIKSLPIEAGQRVHELTVKGIEDSTRYLEYADEIERSHEVCRSRAVLIARTETGRTATLLTQSRALQIGSKGYIWTSAGDHDVRPSHKAMNGEFVRWESPPTLDKLTGHAGALPNCRCWCRTVLPEEA